MTEEFVQGFVADDSKLLTDILTKTYELQELKDALGQTPPNETLAYGKSDNTIGLTISNINEKFPIECLRKNGYSVYKISTGGYFYVFWMKSFNPFPEDKSNFEPDATVYFTAYLSPSSLRKATDFVSIKEGVSTAEDVSQIDPAFELSFLMSSGIRSYSLLVDGSIMEIWYENNGQIESRKDLVVKSKNVLSKGSSLAASKLANILSKDLP